MLYTCDSLTWIVGITYYSSTVNNSNLPWGPNTVMSSTQSINIEPTQLVQLEINHDVHPDGFAYIKFIYTDGVIDEFRFFGNGGLRLWDPSSSTFLNTYYGLGVHSPTFMSVSNSTRNYHIECTSVNPGSNNWIFKNLDSGLTNIELRDSSNWQGLMGSTVSLVSNRQPSFNFTSSNGCDSIVTLDLTINNTIATIKQLNCL